MTIDVAELFKPKRGRRRKVEANRAIAYIRISPREEQTGLGPEAQRHAIELHAQRAGLTVVVWFEDIDVSGAAPIEERPALNEALEAFRVERAGVLIVAKRCRLARDQMVAAMLHRLIERDGGRIDCADGVGNGTDPQAVMMRGMVDLFAQYERALIRMRTKAALAAKKRRGERVGQVPYGYHVGPDTRTLEPSEREQAVIARIHKLSETSNPTAIARVLNEDGVPARGAKWHTTTIRRVLGR